MRAAAPTGGSYDLGNTSAPAKLNPPAAGSPATRPSATGSSASERRRRADDGERGGVGCSRGRGAASEEGVCACLGRRFVPGGRSEDRTNRSAGDGARSSAATQPTMPKVSGAAPGLNLARALDLGPPPPQAAPAQKFVPPPPPPLMGAAANARPPSPPPDISPQALGVEGRAEAAVPALCRRGQRGHRGHRARHPAHQRSEQRPASEARRCAGRAGRSVDFRREQGERSHRGDDACRSGHVRDPRRPDRSSRATTVRARSRPPPGAGRPACAQAGTCARAGAVRSARRSVSNRSASRRMARIQPSPKLAPAAAPAPLRFRPGHPVRSARAARQGPRGRGQRTST